MAIYRNVHTTYWSDSFISELDPIKKLFFIYLLTNERTTQCGIYEITKRQISFDLGVSIDEVTKLIDFFENAEKIVYSEETNEMAIINWNKYNKNKSPKVISAVNKGLTMVKNRDLIEYVYNTDTVSIPYEYHIGNKNKNKNNNKNKNENENKNKFSQNFEIELSDCKKIFLEDERHIEILCMNYHKSKEEIIYSINSFFKKLETEGAQKKSINDAKKHFANWYNHKINTENNGENKRRISQKSHYDEKL
ncbi:MAG: hypothetical protein GX361_03820 [Bacteroidales bacterium]|nr:hypothetical protein [Bacteroidales bacterium]